MPTKKQAWSMIECPGCGAEGDDIDSQISDLCNESVKIQFHCLDCGEHWIKKYVEEE